AHPAVDEMERILPALVQEGLDGIEVRHPAHDARAVQRYRALAERHGLVPTGGSDFHRPEGPVPLGHFGVDAAALAALRARCRV
ncbi:MAG: PHP domain-containing protein, partial [Myxococcales bacterium]|nr:PHP domain-containing protein [Myxococcales bacterium]